MSGYRSIRGRASEKRGGGSLEKQKMAAHVAVSAQRIV